MDAVESLLNSREPDGVHLGWRFLYGPMAALTLSPKLMMVGLNPGGRFPEPSSLSVESGNAFRVEKWQSGVTYNTLQRQIIALFKRVAAASSLDWQQLMDSTPTLNFCPYRSPSWALLPNKAQAISTSMRLWELILREVTPSLILCNGIQTGEMMSRALASAGYRSVNEDNRPVGWGAVTYNVTTLQRDGNTVSVLALPHLSRYPFIGRSASVESEREIVRMLSIAILTGQGCA